MPQGVAILQHEDVFCYFQDISERPLYSASGLQLLPKCISRKVLGHPQQGSVLELNQTKQ